MPAKPKKTTNKNLPLTPASPAPASPPASPPPSKVPHPVDDLIQAEPRMDAKLASLDPRKLSRLRRIARLERGFCGEAEW